MKPCTTCDYCQQHPEGHVCGHPELVNVDPVTGDADTLFCQDERRTGRCGPDGLWHETDGELTEDDDLL